MCNSCMSEFTSPYSPNTSNDRRMMLDSIGVDSVEELFRDIPSKYRNPILDIPSPTAELDLRRELESVARENIVPGEYACFLGAGAYQHYVPSVVRQIVSRGEYMTSYTPYQPEISQGVLQTTYEFQSLVCQLTGMEVANAGMYDGSTALAEATLMAARITKRDKVAVLDTVSPTYLEVMKTYAQAPRLEINLVSNTEPELDDETACLVVQQPNFFGYIEELFELSQLAHSHGALFVVYTDPISLGLLKPPSSYDADIAVAEGQSMGVQLSYGGPYVGFFACKERFLRQIPGRIVGKTEDTNGNTGYVLTMQTREQHIRRERATSNICTSVALVALAATVFMSSMGKQGMKHISEICYHKSHYAASLISKIPGYSLPMRGSFFREFVVRCPISPSKINKKLLDYGIIGGLDISSLVDMGMLVCVTEMNPKSQIDAFVKALEEIVRTSND